MSYVTISAQIKALLATIVELNAVYDYEAKELLKYPCATVTAMGHKNEFNDLAANKRRFQFVIRVYNRTDSASDGERIMKIVADKVLEKIEGNVTLNSSCDWAIPSEAKWGYVEREVPLRFCEITVEALKRVNR